MLWLRFLLVLACAVLCSPRAQAAPAPIVFDFEDGLQGWELRGAAQRVQTQVLGGEWAIFADGFVAPADGSGSRFSDLTGIFISMDLTDIASISVEQFFVDGSEDGLLFSRSVDLIENIFIGTLQRLDIVEPGNPSLRAFNVSSLTGVTDLGLAWATIVIPNQIPPIVAFIDNITFHPVPEPSTLLLVSAGLAAIVIARRQLRIKEIDPAR